MKKILASLWVLLCFFFADAPYTLEATHPKVSEVILDGFEHVIAEQALFGCVVRERSVAPAKESVALRPNPKIVRAIFVQRQHGA